MSLSRYWSSKVLLFVRAQRGRMLLATCSVETYRSQSVYRFGAIFPLQSSEGWGTMATPPPLEYGPWISARVARQRCPTLCPGKLANCMFGSILQMSTAK